MPYRIVGNKVYVKRGRKWEVLKTHKSHAQALAHFRALMANVPEAKHGK